VSGDLIVDYDAGSSYVIIVGGCSLDCLAGNCPASVNPGPAGCGSGALAISGTRGVFSGTDFGWVFHDSGGDLVESGLGKVRGIIGFASPGEKTIDLTVTHGGAEESFSRAFTLLDVRQCTDGGTVWLEIAEGAVVRKHDTMTTLACAGKNQLAGDGDDCCPGGGTCSDGTGEGIGCQLEDDGTDEIGGSQQCVNYADETSCNDDPSHLAENNPLFNARDCGTSANGENLLCQCVWHENVCKFGKDRRTGIDPDNPLSQCVYDTVLGTCQTGYQTVSITATLLSGSDPECRDSEEVLPCGRPQIQLPFFGLLQLGLVFLVLAGWYLFVGRRD
jgi:hypothetical protein